MNKISPPMPIGSSPCVTAPSSPMNVRRRSRARRPSPHRRLRRARRIGPAYAEAGALAFAQMIVTAAVQAILRNKLRSALTMLGVFVGVAALIAMVAVGQGANERVRKQIESLGTNLVVVLPGATSTSGVRAGFGSASTLTVADAQAIRRECPAVGACQLSDAADGPGSIRQSELDDECAGRLAELSADHQLDDRGRPRHQPGGRPRRRACRRARPDRLSPALRRQIKIRSAPRSSSRAFRCG